MGLDALLDGRMLLMGVAGSPAGHPIPPPQGHRPRAAAALSRWDHAGDGSGGDRGRRGRSDRSEGDGGPSLGDAEQEGRGRGGAHRRGGMGNRRRRVGGVDMGGSGRKEPWEARPRN